MKKLNIQSNKGFTMTELIIALTIFGIFTGIIGSLMYSSYKTNLQIKMAGLAGNYAIQILEYIDKIEYNQVENGMENQCKNVVNIPSGFELNIGVSNYNEGTDKEDLIKKVKLTITYELFGNTEQLIINKLKVKEI